jgi:uncharacterized membrane protein
MFIWTAKGWNYMAKALCGLCAFLILMAAGFAIYRWSYLKHATKAKAVITNLIEEKDDRGSKLYAPVYVFTNQHGEAVEITSSTSSFPPPGKVGATMEVFYDPEDPKHSVENRFFSLWGFPAIMGGLGAFYFVVCATIAFFTGRHLKRQAQRASMVPPVLEA